MLTAQKSFAGHCLTEPVRHASVPDWDVELLPKAPYETSYVAEQAVIGFAFDAQSGEHGFAGSRRKPFRAPPNGLAYVPAGCDVYSRSPGGGEYLRIIRRKPHASPPCRSEHQFSGLADPAAIQTAHRLRRYLVASGTNDDPVIEGLVLDIAARVTAIQTTEVRAPSKQTRYLTPYRARQVDEMIHTRMDRKLLISDIAAALGLSSGFLARAFKASVGKPLHDHVTDCRLSRARELVVRTDGPLADIALRCGFSSHAHMTSVFRSRLGITPQKLRTACA